LGDQVVRISDIPGPRWDLALEKMAAAGPLILLEGGPWIGLQRYDGWPGADGRIHVSIFKTLEPPALTQEVAERDVRNGLAHLETVVASDPRLAQLLAKYGVVREYVCDYGNGAVRVGIISGDGAVTLG